MATADELVADARDYAGGLVTASESALSAAISAVEWARAPNVGHAWASLPKEPLQDVPLVLPTLADITLDLPVQPANTLVFQDISPITTDRAPVFGVSAPTINLPSQPSQLAAFTASLPTINLSAQFPVAPDMIMPEAPILLERIEPTAPTTVLPVFGGQMPAGLPAAPTDLAGSLSAAYHTAAPEFITMVNGHVDAELIKLNPQYHAQLAAIEAQLTKYMAGGTGLNPAVENAIYERARGKNDAEARRVRDQAYSEAAARGFTLPSGASMSAMQQARQAGADNNARAAGEIVVMQAEMEQKNLQFAVTTSAGLRTAAVQAALSYMQNLGQLNGQALDYAKSVMTAIIEMYNTDVKVYAAKLDAYKTEATVFETLTRGALAGVEVYKAEIAALQAMTQVDHSRVEVYKARIDVLTSMSNMYRTRVEAVISKAALEKLKIDVFQAQVQAHSSQVQAKSAEWQGYTAAIGGETAKVHAYATQAQAYNSQVLGFKAEIEAKSEVVRAAALTNDARAKQYSATMSGYQTVVQAKGETARVKLENQRQQVVAFQAQTQAVVARAQIEAEYYKATGMVSIENAKLAMQSMIADVDAKSNYTKLLATLHTANATVHGNLAGAAMAGMNSLVAMTENK